MYGEDVDPEFVPGREAQHVRLEGHCPAEVVAVVREGELQPVGVSIAEEDVLVGVWACVSVAGVEGEVERGVREDDLMVNNTCLQYLDLYFFRITNHFWNSLIVWKNCDNDFIIFAFFSLLLFLP